MASDMAMAYYYLPARNPQSASLPGVPLADLSAAEVAAFPPHVRMAVARCRFYQSAEARAAAVPIAAAPRSVAGLATLQAGPTSTEVTAEADVPSALALSEAATNAAASMAPIITALETPPTDAPKPARARQPALSVEETPPDA